MKVRSGRERYLAESGYSETTYSDPRFVIGIGKLNLTFRNPGKVHYHDLHHVVSGYTTGLVGEAEVSAYELRGGYHTFMIWFFSIGAVGIGLFLSPRRVIRAWRLARGARTLYDSPIPYDDLLEMELIDLRSMLNIPAGGFRS
jgi:hypothetical protein